MLTYFLSSQFAKGITLDPEFSVQGDAVLVTPYVQFPSGSFVANLNSNGGANVPVMMLSGETFQIEIEDYGLINIYEYPISGSGTEQGMDYIEP